MEKADDILKRAAVTLEKYQKNKTRVSPEDLAGKYRVPFQKLKAQLADELSLYLKLYSLERLVIRRDDLGYLDAFADDVNRVFEDSGIGKRVGRAAFQEYDLDQVKQLAEELRIQIYEKAWVPYFRKHIGLYITTECLSKENPQSPRIYNSLVDKFWDEGTGMWVNFEGGKQ